MTFVSDEATRYLAAAVHLDDELADLLVEEYLTAPKRAVPPAPGVRAEVVLREAVTAQARRRVANLLVVGVFALFTLLSFAQTLSWLLSAVCWRVASAIVRRMTTASSGPGTPRLPAGPRVQWWSTFLAWVLVSPLWLWLPVLTLTGAIFVDQGVAAVQLIVVAVCQLALIPVMLIGLVGKEHRAWDTALTQYSFSRYNPNLEVRPAVQKACARYANRIARIARADIRHFRGDSPEVVVFRGSKPFLGAGRRVRSWSAAFELRPDKADTYTDELPVEFTPSELQDSVANELSELREATFLSPENRFTELGIADWTIVSADHLSYVPEARPLVEQLISEVDPELPVEHWNALTNCSQEWIRHFRCYRLEGWARQIAVSGFLHVSCERRMLVLEWHGFVLPPLAPEFRLVDIPPNNLELRALWNGITELAQLPLTIPARIADVVRGMRPPSRMPDWSSPAMAADTFGASLSIRELAADNQVRNFFANSDCNRYLQVLEHRMLDAVRRFLAERSIVAKGFDEMATQISNSMVFQNSNVVAGNIGGHGNAGSVGDGAPADSNASSAGGQE